MSRFIIPGLIIGSKVSIAKFGASIGSGDQAKTVSADWLPVPPSDEDPGPWLYMGKVRTSNPQIEPKTAEIEGTSVGGPDETEEMQLVTKRKFLFASNYITPEFLQLSFGLREDWGTEQVVFAAGSTQIDRLHGVDRRLPRRRQDHERLHAGPPASGQPGQGGV